MTSNYLSARLAHLRHCRSKLAEHGAHVDPAHDRYALVAWGAWTPGNRPSTKLAAIDYIKPAHPKDDRVWGRVETGGRWAKFTRSFERETVIATFKTCPSIPMLKALKKALPKIPEGTA